MGTLHDFFRFSENHTNLRTEIVAGLTTFLTMAYIIFVNPAVLSTDLTGHPTGLDPGAVLLATCLSSALATLVMGLYAGYPIALAPGMGCNFFFVSVIMTLTARGVPDAWRVTLGMVFIGGLIFLLLSLLRIRELIIDSISPSLKSGIAVGIGLFIAFIGLRNGGLITYHPGTWVGLNSNMLHPDVAVFALGLLVTAALHARRIPGAILAGIGAAMALALLLGRISWPGNPVGLPHIEQAAAFRMDLSTALSLTFAPFIVIFVFMNMFDTVGTMIGVLQAGGYIRDNKIPRASRVLITDALGTVAGAALGTSTVTAYIESAAGVEQGGRTGLTSVVVAILFLLALLFSPLIALVGGYPPITAAALFIVGTLMMENVRQVAWSDPGEAIPAFLIMIGIPLCYSIADGLALGFISYPFIKLLSGKGKEVRGLMILLGLLMLGYLAFRSLHPG